MKTVITSADARRWYPMLYLAAVRLNGKYGNSGLSHKLCDLFDLVLSQSGAMDKTDFKRTYRKFEDQITTIGKTIQARTVSHSLDHVRDYDRLYGCKGGMGRVSFQKPKRDIPDWVSPAKE